MLLNQLTFYLKLKMKYYFSEFITINFIKEMTVAPFSFGFRQKVGEFFMFLSVSTYALNPKIYWK